MARLVGTAVGAIAGSFIPGVGTALGASIGGFVGGLFDPGQDQVGPRLDDRRAPPQGDGAPVTWVQGTALVACEQIWVQGDELIEVKTTTSPKGGPSYTEFSYYATFAVKVCEGLAAGVLQIRANGEVIASIDASLFENIDVDTNWTTTRDDLAAALAATGVASGVEYTVYLGTETQEPDPLIVADRGDASAYRGICYIVFERLPLARYQNQIPLIEAVVVMDGAASRAAARMQDPTDGLGFTQSRVSWDPIRRRLYAVGTFNGGTQGPKVLAWSTDDGSIVVDRDLEGEPQYWGLGVSAIPETIEPSEDYVLPLAVSPDGERLMLSEHATDQLFYFYGRLHYLDAQANPRGSHSTDDNAFVAGLTHGAGIPLASRPAYHFFRNCANYSAQTPTGGASWLYVFIDDGNIDPPSRYFWRRVLKTDAGRVEIEGQGVLGNGSTQLESLHGVVGDVDEAGDYLYVAYTPASGTTVTVEKHLLYDPTAQNDAIEHDQLVGALAVGSAIGAVQGCIYDRDADHFVVWGDDGVVTISPDLVVTNTTALDLGDWDDRRNNMTGVGGHRNGFVWLADSGSAIYRINTATGAVDRTIATSSFGSTIGAGNLGPIWELEGGALAAHFEDVPSGSGGEGQSHPPVFLFPDLLTPNEITRASAIQAATERAGIPAAQIDVSGVTGNVYGYVARSGGASIRSVIEDLMQNGAVDPAEVDGKIVYRTRTGAVDKTIAETKLGANGAARLKETIEQIEKAPRIVEVTAADPAANYEVRVQTWQAPAELVQSDQIQALRTAEVLPADRAFQIASRIGETAIVERREIEIAVDYTQMEAAPADVLSTTVGAATHLFRVEEIEGDWVLTMRGRATDAASYNQTGAGADTTEPPLTIPRTSDTDVVFVDSHLASDQDIGDAGFYVAAAPMIAALDWPGAAVLRGVEVGAYSPWVALDQAAVIGAATHALAEPDTATVVDEVNTLTVYMQNGAPAAATAAEIAAGGNMAALATGDDWELIQFRDVTDNGDGTFTLGGLYRGRRGTDDYMAGHAAGDRFILYDRNRGVRAGAADLNLERYFLPVTFGGATRTELVFPFTNQGRAERAYSVENLRQRRASDGAVTLSWTPRYRRHGIMWTSTQDSETSWEVDVYEIGDNPATSTITYDSADGVTSTGFALSAAVQATDFGSASTLKRATVYQVIDGERGPGREIAIGPKSAWRWVRLYSTSWGNDVFGGGQVAEFDIYEAGGIVDLATDTSKVTASSERSGNPADDMTNAVDGDAGTTWWAGLGATAWLKYDLVSPTFLRRVDVTAYFATYAPTDLYIQGSNDDAAWTNIHAEFGLSWGDFERKTFTLV